MDDATLERLAIQEICDELKKNESNSLQKTKPCANKRFLGRTLKAVVNHNNRQRDKEKINSYKKFKELDKGNTDNDRETSRKLSRPSRRLRYSDKKHQENYKNDKSKTHSHSQRKPSDSTSNTNYKTNELKPNSTQDWKQNENYDYNSWCYQPLPCDAYSKQVQQQWYEACNEAIASIITSKSSEKTKSHKKKKSKDKKKMKKSKKRNKHRPSASSVCIVDLTEED